MARAVTPRTMITTPIVWRRPIRSPNRKYAATAAMAANWLPMTPAMAIDFARAPGREHRTEDLARAGDHDERERGLRHSEPALDHERCHHDDEAEKPGRQGDPRDRHPQCDGPAGGDDPDPEDERSTGPPGSPSVG